MNTSHLIKPVLNGNYPVVSYGEGIYLYDEEGKQYLDGCSGAVTASIGHGVQEVIDAIYEQGKKVAFVYRSQFTNKPAELLAEKIVNLLNHQLNWVFFVNSGSEATETALKIAIQYWQEKGDDKKTKIISRWISYHGITMGALSMSGHTIRRSRFTSLLEDYPLLNPPYCYRCPYNQSYPTCQLMCAEELEKIILRIGPEHIAAFIAEPIIGAAGAAITPPEGYYETIYNICKKYNILFIADEVMTGCGRTGKMLSLEHWGVVPDIVALGKGLSAGYAPLAATVVKQEIFETIQKGSNLIMSGHTLSANPLSTAAGLAVLKFMEKHQLFEAVLEKGAYLMTKLKEKTEGSKTIGDIRGKGLLVGVELVFDRKTKQPFKRELNATEKLVQKSKEKGLLIYPSNTGIDGVHGDAVIIAPPLTITKEEIDVLIDRFCLGLKDFEQDILKIDRD